MFNIVIPHAAIRVPYRMGNLRQLRLDDLSIARAQLRIEGIVGISTHAGHGDRDQN